MAETVWIISYELFSSFSLTVWEDRGQTSAWIFFDIFQFNLSPRKFLWAYFGYTLKQGHKTATGRQKFSISDQIFKVEANIWQ